ncbi:MAG: methyltransferase domain-containing protein [Candidatus Levybacteria bacterium]|nr:methyltransferase domain-containing protein [Candidatus Levybacteria bacterium]
MAGALHESQFSFEAAGKDPQYTEINKSFINTTLEVIPGSRIVDIGSGTGMLTRLIRGRYYGLPATIIGVEPDRTSFAIAQKEIGPLAETNIQFLNAGGENLLQYVDPGSVDQIFMGNNVHELRRYGVLELVMQAAASALRPEGRLAFNTTFVREAMTEPRPWGVWKATTARLLEAQRDKTASAYEYASLDEIIEVARKTGLEVVRQDAKPVAVQTGMLKAIAGYGPFIDGVCGDLVVPEHIVKKEPADSYRERLLEQESQALQEAVDVMAKKQFPENPEAFTLPRSWITVVMEKPKE